MKTMLGFFMLISCQAFALLGQAKQQTESVTIAFYNLENLFDYEDDPKTFDDDRTPHGKDLWTKLKYTRKLANMASVIRDIGPKHENSPPVIIGVCEIENRRVVNDLIKTEALAPYRYDFVHFDSPDRRGIDVALLYRKDQFRPIESKKIAVFIYDRETPARRIFTRDQLLVYGLLENEPIYVLVNHWPSRSSGEESSAYRRHAAAKVTKRVKDSIMDRDPKAKIIIMGDFNDNPDDLSIKEVLNTCSKRNDLTPKSLYNPMANLYNLGYGSLAFNDRWFLFDQILVTKSLINSQDGQWRMFKSGIYNPPYLQQPYGPYRNYPFRSVQNGRFTGGYSDHFPAYIQLMRRRPNALVTPLLPR
ncbi:MAG: endonuclease/exonuclease/phosphatase family protein [Bacteroidetes bacterium]|nr:endonuclease/exonuclease/phosphatase family protein [Bacteroidota bacterium]